MRPRALHIILPNIYPDRMTHIIYTSKFSLCAFNSGLTEGATNAQLPGGVLHSSLLRSRWRLSMSKPTWSRQGSLCAPTCPELASTRCLRPFSHSVGGSSLHLCCPRWCNPASFQQRSPTENPDMTAPKVMLVSCCVGLWYIQWYTL